MTISRHEPRKTCFWDLAVLLLRNVIKLQIFWLVVTSFSRKDDGNYSRRWQCFFCRSLLLYFLSWMRSVVLTVSLFYALYLRNFCSSPNIWSRNSAPIDMAKALEQTVGYGFLFGWVPAMNFSWNVSQIEGEQIRSSCVLYLLCIPALVF